jgi:beta-galactosidase
LVRVEINVRDDGRKNWSVTHHATYSIYGDGSIVVANNVVPSGQRIPLGRVGVRLLLDKRFDQFVYLGRGPMENYSDRKRGSDVGLFSSSVREQLTPYSKPMESGNHEDVRWAAVTGVNLPSLLARNYGELLQVSALPYTDEQLDSPEYSIDLPESSATVLCLDVRTLGVGSNSCGPRPLDQYTVWSDPIDFKYVLRILPSGERDLSVLGREAASSEGTAPASGGSR